MAEIRCPMCGELNPDDLEVCQYCEARLKPLIIQSEQEDEPESWEDQDRRQFPTRAGETRDLGEATPDWLESLRSESDEEQPEGGEEQESPNWLRSGDTVLFDSDTVPESPEDGADWLSGFREEGDDFSGAVDQTGPRRGTWEQDLASQADSVTKWLRGLSSDEDSSEAGEQEAEDFSDKQDETPAWLQRVRDRRNEEMPFEEEPDIDSEAESFLAGLRSGPYDERSRGDTALLGDEDDITRPDTAMLSPTSDEEGETPAGWEYEAEITAKASSEEGGLPDWLTSLGAEATFEDEEEMPEASSDDIPAWLADIADTHETGDDQAPSPIAATEMPEEFVSLAEQEDSQTQGERDETGPPPDWLVALEESAGISDVSKEPRADVGGQDRHEVISRPSFETSDSEAEFVSPFTLDEEDEAILGDELPEWLANVSAQQAAGEQEEGLVEGDDLAPANLPSWLEAMRPVEAVSTELPLLDESDQQVEGSGPLAGLRGILPAGPDVAQGKAPAAYSIRLQVSENHQAHANMFVELLKAEGRAQQAPTKPKLSSQHVLRWLAFILLILAIVAPAISGSTLAPLPIPGPEVQDMRELINAIPGDGRAAVLLAVDYEPGFSGEMDAAAVSVLDHLMIKGAFLALVSTTPPGTVQAEGLLAQVNQSIGHDYRPGVQYVNLGYVPGGAAGLLGFAKAPRQVIQYGIDGSEVWDQQQLSNRRDLAGFDLVVVITENPDTARAWVEQVQPSLGVTPLAMVVSAQAEPLVRAYYASQPQQVQGLVSGVAGGAAYESGMPRTSLARKYWDSYSLAVLVGAILLVFGILFNSVVYFLKDRRSQRREV